MKLASPPMARYTRRWVPPPVHPPLGAGKVLGWPNICKLVHALPWEYSYKGLKFAQLLGQLGVFRTLRRAASSGKRTPLQRCRPEPRTTLTGVNVSATLTPTCIVCTENHYSEIYRVASE